MIEPVHVDGPFSLYQGENRGVMRELPAASVDCVVTSPPYWSLRDYGSPPQVWGGDSDCEHEWGDELVETLQSGNFNEGMNERMGRQVGQRKQEKMRPKQVSEGRFCGRCGAWLGQLGLEPTPQLYVSHIVEVFREVRRVLAPHGVCWLNLGDSYARDHTKGVHKLGQSGKHDYVAASGGLRATLGDLEASGLKPKDLVMVPHRVALALQDDGWWMRAEVVWAKPNGMPSSVRDRPSLTHEYVFMLTKQPTYYFDQEAVREAHKEDGRRVTNVKQGEGSIQHRDGERWPNGGRNIRSVWTIPTQPFSAKWVGIEDDDHFAVFPEELVRPCVEATCPRWVCARCGTPRYRLVEKQASGTVRDRTTGGLGAGFRRETMNRQPIEGEFQEGVEYRTIGWTECPCQIGLPADSFAPILTPLGDNDEGVDDPSMETGRAGLNRPRNDGEGVRLMTRYEQRDYAGQLQALDKEDYGRLAEAVGRDTLDHYARTDNAGARPIPPELLEAWIDSAVLLRSELPVVPPGEYRPGRVLDPFGGSCTTGVVARQLNRDSWCIELNDRYVAIGAARVAQFYRRPTPSRRLEDEAQLTIMELAPLA